MACFLVPAAEAAAVSIIKKTTKKTTVSENGFLKRIDSLGNMLWGGSALLAFEHIWHGEIVPFFPFLTNAASRETAVMMLREMAVSGVGMAALVTAVWAGMVVVAEEMTKSPQKAIKRG